MKTTLITGTSPGIGKALTEILLEKDYKVIGTSTTGESPITHPNFTNLKLDISKPEEITDITQNLKSSLLKETKLDLLINNAGVLLEEWDNPEINMDQLRKTFEINVFGLIDFCEKLIPHINQNGTITNLGSTWGAFSEENKDEFQPHYKISKAAVHMYTKILAARLKPQHIKVLCLDPGWTKTDMGTEEGRLTPKEAPTHIINTALSQDVKTGTFWKEGKLRAW